MRCKGGVTTSMAKVIENKYLKEQKQNIKALKILIEQYLEDGKEEAIKKVAQEQSSKSNGPNDRFECLHGNW